MKKSVAFDYRIFLFALLLLIAGLGAYYFIAVEMNGWMSVLCCVLVVIFTVGIVIIPKFYVGDEAGLSVYYLPFVKEYFRWEDIKRIKLKKDDSSRRSLILDFLFSEYEIVPVKEKRYRGDKYHSIFHSSEISRTALSRRMIKKYWDGEIEDDTFSWFKERFGKNKKNNAKYDLTEVKQKEKQARETVKRIVQQYESKADLHGKTIDASMTYFTDEDDFNSRPKESYSYKTEIFVEKENDEERSFYINVEMIFVSYGKKKIKIIENKNAVSEIESLLNEALEK